MSCRVAGWRASAENRLGVALRAPLGGTGDILGRVDEVDAVRDGVIELLVRLRLRVLLAPRHGAEAYLGHRERGARRLVVFFIPAL